MDVRGKQTTMKVKGPWAERLQHGIDHLDGILALDRPSGVDPFALRSGGERLHPPQERYGPRKPREV